MNALRWTLGVVATLVAIGWIALVVVAGDFRHSFGASGVAPLVAILPLLGALLVLASGPMPGQRWLLHVVAVVVIVLLGGCIWLFREAPFVASCGVLVLGVWMIFYGQAAWSRAPRAL